MRKVGGVSAVCTTSAILIAMLTGVAHADGGLAPQLSQQEVNALVAEADQMGSVESIEAASGGAAKVELTLNPSMTTTAPETLVDVVLMHGQFVDATNVEPGTPPPTGTELALIVNRTTGHIVGTHLGSTAVSLASLGVVEHITPANGAAVASRVGHRTFRPSHGHARAKIATWANNCKIANHAHCYGIAEWAMTGNEEIEGTESEQNTNDMDVVGGDVSDEEWTDFSNGYDVEIGQEGGRYGCCNLYWFMAWRGPNGYEERDGPPYTGEVTPYTWNNYGDESTGDGWWCFLIGPHWEDQTTCTAGYPLYSKHLVDGMEVADESEPGNNGTVVTNATHLNGKIYTWNKATNYAVNYNREYTEHVCVSQYAPENSPGTIHYGTC